ncbi:hypothetical protein BDV27DRAFT_166437 [Aspergillus caelatus]|uniref:Polyketide synthase n=1 Tax=Aspergillus caelatus TaxID=61420 RepID=A0A5N6ZXH8_9EURO|nr:uncharacterized protein BDV27DRAFT_166437 [Aspergillus caelatus]KAE8362115.1 hypothetical protein BDV27DRAFT_166437 [Aspergillus caelatus]
MRAFLFTDQLVDGQQSLPSANRINRGSILLNAFLSKVHVALRDEISLLPALCRAQLPPFNSVVDLIERVRSQRVKRLEISIALLCVYQLSLFFQLIEDNEDRFPSRDDFILGHGPGLLSAAAVACASTPIQLVDLAVEAVRLAFRTGVVITKAGGGIDQPGSEHSFRLIAEGSLEDINRELEDIQDELDIPKHSRAYASLADQRTCVISGHESRLAFLASRLRGRALQRTTTLIPGLWHAPHLYQEQDVVEVLQRQADMLEGISPPYRPIISSLTRRSIDGGNGRACFEQAVHEILRETARWDIMQQELANTFQRSTESSIEVFSFCGEQATTSLSNAIETPGKEKPIVIRPMSESVPSRLNELSTNDSSREKIAIVGFSGRFPGAPDVEALWKVLENGRDMHRTIPKDRFPVETHYDPTGKTNNTSHTPYGCFIEEPGLFDPRFFNMSPREATQTDPMHRLAIVTAYEAMEMSGFVLNSTPSTMADRVGTFYGQTSDDWREVNAAQHIETYFIPGGVRAFAPGRINYHFGFRGPSYSVDTACSSSFAALHIACTALKAGDCDTAVTGGVNILTAPDIYAGLSRGQFLSKTGSCKTWDQGADGYCRADAVGSVVLKRLDDAVAEKDPIFGVILASSTNHCADAVSITNPHSGNQAELYETILHTAGVSPLEVSYVEMHGTGTQTGDLAETRSVTSVFAPKGARTERENLYIGALKSNIGHSEAAAGISSLIKVLMMMEKQAIPPHVGIKTAMNPQLPDFDSLNVKIPFKQQPWPAVAGKPRIAFVNSFSAAGGNTAVLLQEGSRMQPVKDHDPRPFLPFVVSAKSLSALRNNISALIEWIDDNPDVSLGSLSYSLTARRAHYSNRIAMTASSRRELIQALKERLDTSNMTPAPTKPPKVVFVFTGQGVFYTGMAQQLYELNRDFRDKIQQLDRLSTDLSFPSILPIIEGKCATEDASPMVAQLTLTCAQIALVHLWQSWGVQPAAVIGHSLGEYAALHAAGVLSTVDTIHLVGHRARLLEQHTTPGTHGMIAVNASIDELRHTSDLPTFDLACSNSPNESVLSGSRENIQKLQRGLTNAGFKFKVLDIPYSFHSAQLDPILEEFESIASSTIFNQPNVPVISPLLGETISTDGIFNPSYLARHARETVNFTAAVQSAVDEKFLDAKTVLLEIGAHPICSKMVQTTVGGSMAAIPSLKRGENSWKTLVVATGTLLTAGVPIDWHQFHHEYNASHQLLRLPQYRFDNKNYWIDYVNDWCLHKVDTRNSKATQGMEPASVTPKLSTTSVQRIAFEEFNGDKGRVVTQSDMLDPALRAAIRGHMVNGAGLCPSSLYADMALTVCEYIIAELKQDKKNIGLNVGHMEVMNPLIVKDNITTSQLLQLSVTADWAQKQASLQYTSVDSNGKELAVHAKCVVNFEDKANWITDWEENTFWIKDRISMLQDKLERNEADKVSRGTAYKLFASLVSYSRPFQGMEEVIFDGKNVEGTAKVAFQTEDKDGKFMVSPFWIDSSAHISGFLLNGGGAAGSDAVYISHGWKSMRFARALDRATVYTTYVKMQPAPNNVMVGNVYILHGNEVVGVVGGLKFQRIPRNILNRLLPPAGVTKPAASAPATVPTTGTARHSRDTQRPGPTVKSREPQPAPSVPKPIEHAKRIIAEESDLAISELQDDCEFANLGIDSLLSLQISGRIREDLGLDIQGSAFLDNETVGDFMKYLQDFVAAETASTSSTSSMDDSWEAASKVSIESDEIPPKNDVPGPKKDEIRNILRATIAREMDIPLEDVTGSADLSSLGLDSLMSIAILGSLREQTDLVLPSSLFVDYGTVACIEEFLGLNTPTNTAPPITVQRTLKSSPQARDTAPSSAIVSTARAVSILLQGKPSKATKTLFLFPDGSGSATSYATIPPVDATIAVYGLNCPFMTNPSKFTIGISGVATLYLNEVRRRQPRGPYYLGGWSAGGVLAYEVTQQLITQGETVEQLVFFDSPCPVSLPALPKRFHAFLAESGLLGSNGQAPPSWLLPHFEATIKALSEYKAIPIQPHTKIPKVLIIWAQHGVCRHPTDPRPVKTDDEPWSMTWLLDNRTDFGFNGWDRLLGTNSVQFKTVDGNHFTMLNYGEQLHEVASYIKDFLS